MNQEKADDIYRSIISQCNKKGWSPNPKIEHIEWIIAEGSFLTKVAVWNGTAMEEKMGACSVERVIFDHGFAKIMWGENFIDVLKEIASRSFQPRMEYLATFAEEEGIITKV